MTTISVTPDAVVTAVAAVPYPAEVAAMKNDSEVVVGVGVGESTSCSVKELESKSGESISSKKMSHS